MKTIKIAIIGASGYTGLELIRILLNHPKVEIEALIANANAGRKIEELYNHLTYVNLPVLQKIEDVNFSNIDLVFCCLPHAASHNIVNNLFKKYSYLKVIDLSADFRIQDINNYKKWYNVEHKAADLQSKAIYGLSEIYREKIKNGDLIACPGCYPTSILLPLLPLVESRLIEINNINIDSKSGVTGAGRSLKVNYLYPEINDSVKAYSINNHRHIPEIEQELLKISNLNDVKVNFTPHLIPMNRGIISNIYIDIKKGFVLDDLFQCLRKRYKDDYFINISNLSQATKDVLGTNFCNISLFESRLANKATIISIIDNLTKGSSGQAVQNMNIMFGFDEKLSLENISLFP